jgi:hypothetical protein
MGGELAEAVPNADPDTVRQFWVPPNMEPEKGLVPPVAWDDIFAGNRSMRYHLHALDPIGLPLALHSRKPDPRWIDYALPLALDWLKAHPSRETESPFPWYDMAVGLRAYRLAYLLDVVAREASRPDDAVLRLLNGINLHLEALADDGEFAAHSNHGLYQAAGQFAIVRRFAELDESGRNRRQADERLATMVNAQFTEEGVHAEHSPGYHRIMLATLIKLTECGLINDSEALERLERIEDALAWFVRPDRRLAPIGDTDATRLANRPFASARSPALRLMASQGREGAAPNDRIKGFPQSGYVVFRERWPTGSADFGKGAHLVQTCAFHSRVHKHADDLSFTWYERGREVLIDPGRFAYRRAGEMPPELARLGFMYSDPQRIYVESTRAHNTVEIDRRSHNRREPPYGSALDAWGESGHVLWARSSLTFEKRIDHTRMLFFLPGTFLIVVDDLRDHAGHPHHFCQRFHAAPEFNVSEHDTGVALAASDESHLPPLHALPLIAGAQFCGVTRGKQKPDLLGWMSRQSGSFFPTSTFAYERDEVPHARFATLFWWGGDRPTIVSRKGSPNASVFEWHDKSASYRLEFQADGDSADPKFRRSI